MSIKGKGSALLRLLGLLPLEREAICTKSECNSLVMIPNTDSGLGLVGMTCTVFAPRKGGKTAFKGVDPHKPRRAPLSC